MRSIAILSILFLSLCQFGCSKKGDYCVGAAATIHIGQLTSTSGWLGFSSWSEPDLEKVSDKEKCYKYTDNLNEADIVVGGTKETFEKYLANPAPSGQKFLIWTDEPRHYIGRDKFVEVNNIKIPVYNAFTEQLLFNNLYFLDVWMRRGIFSEDPVSLVTPALAESKKQTVIVATYAADTYHTFNMVPEDLAIKRQEIALFGQPQDKIDIYGPNWPAGVSKAESRSDGTWEQKKFEILKGYKFNLAFENTLVRYYVTEKIWDAIRAHALPIYYGNEWIYEDFPKNSFIDYTDLGTPEKLFDFIDAMSNDEWARRLNLCIEVYNRGLEKVKTTDVFADRDALLKRVLNSL